MYENLRTMARRRVVTRTVVGTEYTCMTVDTVTATVGTKLFTLTGQTYTQDKALKLLQKQYDTDTEKVVSIVSEKNVDCIYGMLESDFIRLASRMDEDRHFLEDEEEEEEEE